MDSPGTAKADPTDLFTQGRKGDDAAFESFCAEYLAFVRAIATRIAPLDADDCVQEVFIKALNGPYEECGKIRAWLGTVAHNTAIDFVRRRRKTEQIGEGFEIPAPASADPRLQHAIADCLGTLKPKPRTAFVARYFDHREHDEIAKIVGWKPKTVEARVSEAKKRFGVCLEGHRVRVGQLQ